MTRFELATSTLATWCSTTELHPHVPRARQPDTPLVKTGERRIDQPRHLDDIVGVGGDVDLAGLPVAHRRLGSGTGVFEELGVGFEIEADLLAELDSNRIALDLVLIDADHSALGVQRDIERVLNRLVVPTGPMFIAMHDSGNPECRRGMASADWASCPHVHAVELDFVPGQIRGGEVWGGLALAYLDATTRKGELSISTDAADTVRALHGATYDRVQH